eukprot:3060773-Pleurochrysis_carterae.AAC.1
MGPLPRPMGLFRSTPTAKHAECPYTAPKRYTVGDALPAAAATALLERRRRRRPTNSGDVSGALPAATATA